MNSFNVYGQTETKVGGNTPVWLGTVKPIPAGATTNKSEGVYKAGSAVVYYPENKSFQIIENLEGSGAGMLSSANGYLYNDINVVSGVIAEGENATAAIVMHHPEGLLIERVYPEITEEQIAALQAQIPGVLLVRG